MKPLKLASLLIACLVTLLPVRDAHAAAYAVYQSSTQRPLQFQEISASDHITGVTGLTPTVTLSKNGASFAAPAGAVSEIGNGWYAVAANATDDNTLGVLTLHATAAGCDPTDREYDVIAINIQSGTNAGLSGIPTASPNTAGGVTTEGGTTSANVSTLLNGLILATGTIIDGASTTTVLDTSLPTGGADIYTGDTIVITSGTYKGKSTHILSYNTSNGQVTIPAALPGALTNGTTFELCSFSKTLVNMLAALGTDSKPLLSSSDAQVQAELTAQGYTTARGGKLDALDANVSTRLPSTSYTIPPSTGQIAAAILANPSNLLNTDSSGSPVLSTAVINAVRDAVFAESIDGGVSFKSWVADMGAVSFGSVSQSFNSGTHTLNSTFKRQDNATTGATVSTVYNSSTTSVPVTSRSGTASP